MCIRDRCQSLWQIIFIHILIWMELLKQHFSGWQPHFIDTVNAKHFAHSLLRILIGKAENDETFDTPLGGWVRFIAYIINYKKYNIIKKICVHIPVMPPGTFCSYVVLTDLCEDQRMEWWKRSQWSNCRTCGRVLEEQSYSKTWVHLAPADSTQ